jgi:G6PDH family F420-dependent oxidoreductase
MLAEALSLMEEAWTGKLTTFRGTWFTADNARIFDVPDDGVDVVVAASGPDAAGLAGERDRGLCTTSPDGEVVAAYRAAGGRGPVIGMQHLCWAESVGEALDVVRRWWPHAGGPHAVNAELALPEHFEAVADATAEHLADAMPLGGDPTAVAEALDAYREAGFDRVYVHQVGPDQAGAVRFLTEHVLRELGRGRTGRQGSSAA